MKHLLVLVAFIASFSLFSFKHVPERMPTKAAVEYTNDSVYLCNSATAYVYHSTTSCKGLNHCTHGLIKVSLKDAINKYHRRACKICE